MRPADDGLLLAQLVHRGHLGEAEARAAAAKLQSGANLEQALAGAGWNPETVARARESGGGARPLLPGFELLELLGTGGTAEVFHAREKASGRELALKVLNAHCTRAPATLKSFVDEGRRLEKLRHPAIVEGYGVRKAPGIAPGTFAYFTLLELIEGATLQELLDAGERFGEEELLGFVADVAEALGYLAQHGVVHRDVKPGNLMLDLAGDVRLIDLGFAAACDERAKDGTAAGTREYLAPEQARGGGAADLRSDVYSLGATLFHLLVGRLPFEATDDQELLRQHVLASLSSPEIKSRDVSPHMHYLIERMMAKDPEHRFQSWGELAREIRETRATIAKLRGLGSPGAPAVRKPPPRRRKF